MSEPRPLAAHLVETGCSCCGSGSGEFEVWLLLAGGDVPEEADGICSNSHGYGMVVSAVPFERDCTEVEVTPMYERLGCEWSDDPPEGVARVTDEEIDAFLVATANR